MAQVILSPTWKYLPDTVSWPEKPQQKGNIIWNFEEGEYYEKALTETSRHLVDIAEEDWAEVERLHRWATGTSSNSKDSFHPDTPYTIDAEFEVNLKENLLTGIWHEIARLVKPKEKDWDWALEKSQEIREKKAQAILNPTDSVTSDGTIIVKDDTYSCTNTQDELLVFGKWLMENTYFDPMDTGEDLEDIIARFKISRIN